MKISCPRPLDDGAKLESFGPTMAGVEPTTSGNRTRTTLGTPGALIIKFSLSTDPSNYVRNFQRFAGIVVSIKK